MDSSISSDNILYERTSQNARIIERPSNQEASFRVLLQHTAPFDGAQKHTHTHFALIIINRLSYITHESWGLSPHTPGKFHCKCALFHYLLAHKPPLQRIERRINVNGRLCHCCSCFYRLQLVFWPLYRSNYYCKQAKSEQFKMSKN